MKKKKATRTSSGKAKPLEDSLRAKAGNRTEDTNGGEKYSARENNREKLQRNGSRRYQRYSRD